MSVITKIKQTFLDKEMLVLLFYFIVEKLNHIYTVFFCILHYELFRDIFIRLH